MSDETGGKTTAVAYDAEEAAKDIKEMTEAEPVTVVGPLRTELHPFWKWLVWSLGVGMSCFHLWTAWQGTLPTIEQGAIHLAFGLALIFLVYRPTRNVEKEKRRGLYWTVGGIAVAAYLYYATGMEMTILLPSVAVLVLVQITRYLPFNVGGMPVADVLLAAGGAWAALWAFQNAADFSRYIIQGFPASGYAAATIGTLLVLVAATRAVGLAITIVCTAMLAYALFGRDMPGFLLHSGKNPDQILDYSFLGSEGIFGIPLQVSSTFVFLYMVFAALLQRTGMERFFTNLALGIAGGRVGGTAKVGVITSVFSGTITGSSVANTVSNGAFTIPMMKKAGYNKEFAGAVEAASSTGGQIMPPVMGSAAFIMLAMVGQGVTYADIMLVAIVPAVLFFVAQYIVVHFVSRREGILGLPKDKLPKLIPLLVSKGYLILPLILIFVILSLGFTPMRAAFLAILATVGLNIVVQLLILAFKGVQGWKSYEEKLTPMGLLNGLADAAKMALPIVAATAAAGLISGTINTTALGLKIGDGLIDLGATLSQYVPIPDSQLYLVMFFTMIACLILGMGLPTTANYVVMAVVAVPALLPLVETRYAEWGLEPFQLALIVHMFVFYFGVMADITPPVCLASFAAAGISGGSPVKTGVQSMRIAISGFIVPFAFVIAPGVMLLGDSWVTTTTAVISAVIGVCFLGVAVAGYMSVPLKWWERILMILAALMLLYGGITVSLIGLAVAVAAFLIQYRRRDGGDADAAPTDRPEPAVTAE
ncbi:TRAP transporter permease [Glycomyces buryatensis]|uniref:TRAP transporter permease n=1 Tax=Glycomyces buryatensis TaxID=2570927 RepID=A0A4S8PVU5_9ACTN|nr:TRAP transporter permease [Glycomyces buryatensis]THV34621.1 TRAP transporter permease [Glycomyces buryatensis]